MSIEINGLIKRFGDQAAVDGVTLSVPRGAFFCVVGPSGCGKSTLLRLIAGLDAPDAGTIVLDGQPVAGPSVALPPEARRVGVVFQSYALWPHMTVRGNVAFPYDARGVARAEALALADQHIATVAMTEYADRRPEALSGGQRQRVALARCLAGEARTILMDEPLANLDPHLRATMESELKAFHRRSDVTTLYITHDQREAMALADVMAVMSQGCVLQLGTPQEIYERPANAEVARFIGRGSLVSGALCGTTGTVFLRPEEICEDPEGHPARITHVHYRGGYWEAEARIEGEAEPVRLDLKRPILPGEEVRLRFATGWVLPR